MARLHPELIQALRSTAARIRQGAHYEWGHAGSCNCGHLAQTVTELSRAEIYRMVNGEWSEHLNDFCPITGASMDHVTNQMIRFGFEPGELASLERLSDPSVLAQISDRQHLRRNDAKDVVSYLEAWADLVETRMHAAA